MFDVCVEKGALMKALNYLECAVSKDNPYIMMSMDSNGILQMFTTDFVHTARISLITSSKCQNETCPLLNFKMFKSIISTIPDIEFVTIKDCGNVEVSYGMHKPVKLNPMSNISRPAFTRNFTSQQADDTSYIPSNVIFNAVKNAYKVTDNKGGYQVLSCVKVETDGYDVSSVAYNDEDKCIFYSVDKSPDLNATAQFLIEPSGILKVISCIAPFFDTVVLSQTSSTLKVSSASLKGASPWYCSIDYFISRLNAPHPLNITKIKSALPNEFAKLSTSDFKEAISRVKAIQEKVTANSLPRYATVDVNNDVMSVKYSSSFGEIDEDIILDNTVSANFLAAFNPSTISKIIDMISSNPVHSDKVYIGKTTQGNNYVISNILPTSSTDEVLADTQTFVVAGMAQSTQQAPNP